MVIRAAAAENSGANTVVQSLSRQPTSLVSDATFITFDPGVYSVEFNSMMMGRSDVGLDLPSARIDPVALPNSAGRLIVSTLPQGGWLSKQTATALLVVVGGRAGAVLTIYRPASGMPMPEVRFKSVLATSAEAGRVIHKASVSSSDPDPVQPNENRPQYPHGARITAHIQAFGDYSNIDGGWAGDPNTEKFLEGFTLEPPDGFDAAEVEYQAIMGSDWRTPWFTGGTFCGSRGLQLPLLGFRLRLTGATADAFICQSFGRFSGGKDLGPVQDAQDVYADGLPLVAVRVEFVPRSAATASSSAGNAVPVVALKRDKEDRGRARPRSRIKS